MCGHSRCEETNGSQTSNVSSVSFAQSRWTPSGSGCVLRQGVGRVCNGYTKRLA
jgi:hypothetical protein